MASTYQALTREIEALKKKAEAARKQEAAELVALIRSGIELYGLTAQDLGLDSDAKPAKKAKKAAAPSKVKSAANADASPVAKYVDGAGHAALIHVAKHQLDMSDEAYRELLRHTAGVSSSKDLNAETFAAVMKRFEQLGFVPRHPAAAFAQAERHMDMATAEQVAYLLQLWRQWSGGDDRRQLGHWLDTRFGVADVRFANLVTAQKAIEGLKVMVKRKQSAAAKGSAQR